jgi:hypothetical protein
MQNDTKSDGLYDLYQLMKHKGGITDMLTSSIFFCSFLFLFDVNSLATFIILNFLLQAHPISFPNCLFHIFWRMNLSFFFAVFDADLWNKMWSGWVDACTAQIWPYSLQWSPSDPCPCRWNVACSIKAMATTVFIITLVVCIYDNDKGRLQWRLMTRREETWPARSSVLRRMQNTGGIRSLGCLQPTAGDPPAQPEETSKIVSSISDATNMQIHCKFFLLCLHVGSPWIHHCIYIYIYNMERMLLKNAELYSLEPNYRNVEE